MTRKKAAKKATLQKDLRAFIKASGELLDALDTTHPQVREALDAAGRTLKDPKMSVAEAIARIRIVHAAAKAALAKQA